jgi:predicted metal-dependent phosphotriesterase family hydrolase
MAFIQTVMGRINPKEIGPTYSHDHILMRPPAPYDKEDPDLRLDSVENAIQELNLFRTAGGKTIVEMTTVDVGRAPKELLFVSEATGVHIIAATGYNKDKYCAPFVAEKSVDEIASGMIRELTEGIEDTEIKAGVIKASTSMDKITPYEEKVFQAAIETHLRTGAPISTHTEAGTYALEQIDLLTSAGVKPEHIVIGHLDRKLDPTYQNAIAQTGVFMGFDQISKEKYYPDLQRIESIKRLMDSGHIHQILLSGDWARKSYWPSYGCGYGPGLTYILWRFVPWMLEEGISHDAITAMLVHNPAKAFAWANNSPSKAL